MNLKSSKGFTLIEVLLTVAILSSSIIFVFRAFSACLAANRLSQHITLACYLAQDKLWEAIEAFRYHKAISQAGTENIQNHAINWSARAKQSTQEDLKILTVSVSWSENSREAPYVMDFVTYLPVEK